MANGNGWKLKTHVNAGGENGRGEDEGVRTTMPPKSRVVALAAEKRL